MVWFSLSRSSRDERVTLFSNRNSLLPKLEEETVLKEVSKMQSQKLGEDHIAYDLIS